MALKAAQLVDLDDPLRGPAEPSTQTDQPADANPELSGSATVAAPAVSKPRPRGSSRRRATQRPPSDESAAQEPPHEPAVSPGDPYEGSPKIAVNLRATKQLWDQLGALTRELESQEARTSRTELTEALWHFHMPANADDARELVRRYRRVRIG